MERKPEKGDLIEFPRGLFSHWALYVGHGDVVHLGPVSDDADAWSFCMSSISGSSISGSSSNARSVTSNEAKVRRDKLEDAHCKIYSINNLLDGKREPRPIDEIVKEAQSLVGEIRPYNVITNNCEHFVTLLRYGEPRSQQVEAVGLFLVIVIAIIAVICMWFKN